VLINYKRPDSVVGTLTQILCILMLMDGYVKPAAAAASGDDGSRRN